MINRIRRYSARSIRIGRKLKEMHSQEEQDFETRESLMFIRRRRLHNGCKIGQMSWKGVFNLAFIYLQQLLSKCVGPLKAACPNGPLFLDGVHNADQSQGRGITPFFVRRSTYLAFLGHLSFPGQTAPRTPPNWAVVEYPQETYSESMSGQDAGQADRGQRDSAQRDASHEELASESPSLPQTSQECCIPEETRGEVHPTSESELLPQKWPPQWEAVLEENMGRVEPQSGHGRWGSEASSILGSSYYSTEDEEVLVGRPLECSIEVLTFPQDPTSAHAGDEGHVPEVTDSNKVGIKFVLREGNAWVEQENLSIDPSSPARVEHAAEEHTRKRHFLFNTALRAMAPSECFEAVVGDGTNTVLLIPEGSIDIDHDLGISARNLCTDAGGTGEN